MGIVNMLLFNRLIIISLIIACVFNCCCIEDDPDVSGVVWVKFVSGINESQAYTSIEKYNLTFSSIGRNIEGHVIEGDVRVPTGKEEYYANLLIEDPIIEDTQVCRRFR